MADTDLAPEESVANARTDSAHTHFGADQVEPAALRPVAEAWIDRWRALGGDFGRMRRDGEERLTRGMVVDLDLWTPTDCGNPDLPPHAWLIEERQHEGAVKVLEGLLHLVPGLRDAVFDLIRPTVPAMEEC